MSDHDDIDCECCETGLEIMCANIDCNKLFSLHDSCRAKMTCIECSKVYCTDCICMNSICGALTFSERSGKISHEYCDGEYSICVTCCIKSICEKCGMFTSRCIGCHEIHPCVAGQYLVTHFCDAKRYGWYSSKTGFIKARSTNSTKRQKTSNSSI